MSKTHPPELKKYMDKEIELKLNGNRHVSGILRGFDPFMNMVIDEAVEYPKNGNSINLGMTVIRGNSVVIMEPKERVSHS
ncbi:Protein CBR-SNR-7 [Caenorhabditis briggsae]|uniref:Small nuclear ribonucleoprotein G n=1 Tax=Caenorhabditis briggsae TaxID=6238 RepID=A8WW87_CAEBR|nr:Protein CBR-SNR-7 [Caenorhabditis briggsae]CAP24896.2 Protein CBR-SNR-7 [Caenorhabditis briggsae]